MQTDTPIRTPRWNAGNQSIDCEIEHPVFGWIPFTASPKDIEAHGRAIFAHIVATMDVAEYAPPETEE
jgi:hypothetical protein